MFYPFAATTAAERENNVQSGEGISELGRKTTNLVSVLPSSCAMEVGRLCQWIRKSRGKAGVWPVQEVWGAYGVGV